MPTGPLPLGALLGLAAAAVVICASILSHHAARHPGLPSGRWTKPLPKSATGVIDDPVVRWLLRGLGIASLAAGLAVLAVRTRPIDPLVWWPVFTLIALLVGPAWRLVNPGRVGTAKPQKGPEPPAGGIGAATGWLFVLLWATQSTFSPWHIAAIVVAYTIVQIGFGLHQGPTWHIRGDALEVLADVLGHLAPIGRGPRRLLVWRNPVVATAQARCPQGLLALAAVVIGGSVTAMIASTAIWPDWAAPFQAATRLLTMAVASIGAALVLRLGIIRPWLRSAAVPLVAAYGLMIGGWRLPPFDLLAFVGLHLVAVAVAHRQAVARLDLRMARAVQFPLRVVLVTSIVGGIALASAAR